MAMLRFTIENIRQWKWRLCGIALLIAMTFTLHVLYASFVEAAQADTLSTVAALDLPYDLLVLVAPRERILSREELPALPRIASGRDELQMLGLMEPSLHFTADSAYGSFNVLGVSANSNIFSPLQVEYEGRWLASPGEIILPQGIAESQGLQIGSFINLTTLGNSSQWGIHHRSYQLVGTYKSNDLSQALMLYEDSKVLTGLSQPNACMFTYPHTVNRDVRRNVTLESFTDWLRQVYPQAVFISALTPETLSAKLLGTIYQPGQGLLFLIVIFAFVGVTTIAIMTYLERRREFAALKTQGISTKQLIAMFSVEYGVSGALGLGLGGAALFFLGSRIEWIGDLAGGTVFRLCLTAGLFILAAVILAVLYPVATSLVASVNQLLYARRIPFRNLSTDHLERPSSEQVYREHTEAVRLLKLPALEATEHDILMLKNIGDRVKKGETVALQEQAFGYAIFEWKAFCDGEVVSLESSGLIAIRPDNENEPFFPYPRQLLATEERRRKAFEKH